MVDCTIPYRFRPSISTHRGPPLGNGSIRGTFTFTNEIELESDRDPVAVRRVL